jgi:small conductance mechanosensitive channel
MDGLTLPLEWAPWTRIAGVILVGLLSWLLVGRAMHAFREVLVERSEDDEDDKRIETVMRVGRDVLGIVLIALVLMLVLSELGLSIAPLLGTAGVAGIAFALAAQGIARDLLAGISLLVDNKLRVGDDVEIAGKAGIVEMLTIRTVRLRDREGTVHFVRTGDIGTVSNRSLGRR